MKLLVCAALALLLNASDATAARRLRAETAPRCLAFDNAAHQTGTRRPSRRPKRQNKKRQKPMPQPAAPTTPKPDGPTSNAPILDGPNRMEIDPGDIPPSERPRDPNVDDRTKIPAIIDPNDMAPQPKPTPKKKRPPQSTS